MAARRVTEPVQLVRTDDDTARRVFTPDEDVPEEWLIPDEYLAGGSKKAKAKAEAKEEPADAGDKAHDEGPAD